jgi:hypothetical protein
MGGLGAGADLRHQFLSGVPRDAEVITHFVEEIF